MGKKPAPSKGLLVDGDILLYRVGFRAQQDFKWDDNITSRTLLDFNEVTENFRSFVDNLQAQTLTSRVFMCFTGKRPFRYEILKSYKHNRKEAQKPELYQRIKDWAMEEYLFQANDCLEADDIMGIISTKFPGKWIIATIDKDLQQIPGWHYNWDKNTEPHLVSKAAADRWFWRQCLTGDSVDGFSGVPGVGPKRAEKILATVESDTPAEPSDYWQAIVEEYQNKGLDEGYAITQARMARILRDGEFDFETMEPIWWEPPRKK